MVRGAEHFATLDPESASAAQRRAELEAFLADVGAGIEDMTSGYALATLTRSSLRRRHPRPRG